MKAVKKMIYLEPDQERLLKKIAAEEKLSETEVMRRALDLYASERNLDPWAGLVGIVAGGDPDEALNHDAYIYLERPVAD